MNKLKSVLVGVDFSPCSRVALEQAVRLARHNNARLHAVHVVEHLTLDEATWTSHIPHHQLEKDALIESRRLLQTWLEKMDAPDDVEITSRSGIPLAVLVETARAQDSSLVVVGVNGTSMLPLGSGMVATKCLRKSPSKVLLVHPRQTGAFEKVVVGVDFSVQSKEAVAQSLRVAAQDNSELHFVHVFTGSWGRYALVPDIWEVDPAVAAQYREALERHLREFVGDTGGHKTHFRVVEAESHGHGLAEYTRQVRGDLVVLGTKGRSNIGYVLAGSTVERLLRELPCSALAVRP